MRKEERNGNRGVGEEAGRVKSHHFGVFDTSYKTRVSVCHRQEGIFSLCPCRFTFSC